MTATVERTAGFPCYWLAYLASLKCWECPRVWCMIYCQCNFDLKRACATLAVMAELGSCSMHLAFFFCQWDAYRYKDDTLPKRGADLLSYEWKAVLVLYRRVPLSLLHLRHLGVTKDGASDLFLVVRFEPCSVTSWCTPHVKLAVYVLINALFNEKMLRVIFSGGDINLSI